MCSRRYQRQCEMSIENEMGVDPDIEMDGLGLGSPVRDYGDGINEDTKMSVRARAGET